MIQAFAPRNPRGYSWVLLTIAALFVCAGVADAQTTKARSKTATGTSKTKDDASKDDEPKAKDASKKDDDEPNEKKGEKADAAKGEAPAEEPEAPKKEPAIEVFKDPRAEAILQKKFTTIGRLPDQSKKSVVNMAVGAENADRAVIQRFVDGATYMLTNPANVAALVEGKGGSKALEIKKGTDDLLEVLHKAQANKNTAFLTEYNRILVATLPKLLENNLFARIEAMIVLGQTGNPEAIPVFVKQLADANQTVWVKIWAARGITSAAGGGTREVAAAQAGTAAKAIADWLDKEKDLPWFAQMRALEALGALRQAKTPQKPDQPVFANVAMRFLADKEARPEVRAMAAWALGMMRIDNALSKFNFSLVAHNVAEVAADLGDKVVDVFDANQNQSRYYTSFLLYQIHPALEGDPKVRDAGILKVPGNHAGFNQAKPFLQQVDDLVKSVYKASVELLNAPRGKQKDLQKQLANRVDALRKFLQKNPPADTRLVPGGQAFPGNQVAAAPDGK
ncbi:MAG: hypothetical protein P4L84_05680 [Isosphaeraceae bacterium]|nr:hypothetical protein [Isosphaeraceae bacterium]